MADSLFDNRYRYDFIYPRGRSGETLRAVDTQDNDRPVVIKRPAPLDAPPIRYGQEVSILNERKALMRLAGNPAVTALLDTGQFSVSGTTHQYIVMERAEGVIIADLVLELAARGERLPELEMLVILDKLLELLYDAHAHDIIYNDVDAKHLFWDRENYRLKVIDWGNAVFLEGDEATPQGISRQTDIFQVGELMYSILMGGGRLDVPREADADFKLSFGENSERIHSRLQSIVSRAAHPNPRLRYSSITELRRDLSDYRAPIERDRNALLNRVVDRLRRDLSKDDLIGLLKMIEPALAIDPGYPAAKNAHAEILNRLSDLEVAADLDAARIYLQSANWARASRLLEELRPRSRGETAGMIALLLDWCTLLLEYDPRPVPPGVMSALDLIFDRQADRAAIVLLTQGVEDESARGLQLLLAERISAQLPDILLLRPSLYRLEVSLARLAADGLMVNEPRTLLSEINAALDDLSRPATANLTDLRDGFQSIVTHLHALASLLDVTRAQHGLTNRQLPVTTIERALNAAMGLADNMHVIGKQAVGSPRDATRALDVSRAIDPTNAVWDQVARLLNNLYDLLNRLQAYLPAADGADLEDWLKNARRDLQPFLERLFDETLVSMALGLEIAATNWAAYAAAAVQGNRVAALAALSETTDSVSAISPALAGWMSQLRTIITGAAYVERHALHGGLGRALADGWENFDRSRLMEAERLGIQAFEAARSDAERFAARRLRDLAEAVRDWVERGAAADAKRTQTLLAGVELLLTADEIGARDSFTAQMPSKDTFLKAMNKGLVDQLGRTSTAAVRVLFANFILRGVLDAHADALDDARFWRDAAVKCLGDYGGRHIATRTLEDFIDRRHDLLLAGDLINNINGSHALPTIESARRALEENPQARLLSAPIFSLRELEAALRDWTDGEFRAAAIKLENAVRAVDEAENAAAITLTQYRAFLMDMLNGAGELHGISRKLNQAVESRSNDVATVEAMRTAHRQLFEVSNRLLGAPYSNTLREWRDTFDGFLSVYADRTMRRSAKLTRFSDLMGVMFLDRHPAYPVYRRWYSEVEASPEFPPPPTDEPTPRLTEDEPEAFTPVESRAPRASRPAAPPAAPAAAAESVPVAEAEPVVVSRSYTEPADEPEARSARRMSPVMLIGLLIAGVLALLALAAAGNLFGGAAPPTSTAVVSEPSPVPPTQEAILVTEEATPIPPDSPTPLPTDTPTQIVSPTPPPVLATVPPRGEETATFTRTPSLTPEPTEPPPPTATDTATPTDTLPPPTATDTPRPTLPPNGLQGDRSLLNPDLASWDTSMFAPSQEGNFWRLGTGSANLTGESNVVSITVPPDVMEAAFGNNAATRILSIEATMTLITWNPPLVLDDQVFFGAMLTPADDPAASVGLEVQLEQPGILNLGVRRAGAVQLVGQRAVSAYQVRLRLVRDPGAATVSLFVDGSQLGQPVPFVGTNAPVIPVLYVRNGEVIIHVDSWTVNLR